MITKIKRDDIEKIDFYVVPNDGRENINQVFAKFQPDYIINGSMYDMSSGKTCADAIDEGKLVGGGNWSDKGIGIKNNKDLSWTTTAVARKDGTRDFIGSAPTLVIDSKINMDTKGLNSSFYASKKIRSFIGFNDTELLIGCSDSTISCSNLAQQLIDSGAKYALNLDGGGSSSCGKMNYSTGKMTLLNKPTETRKNANWILIYLKPEVKPAPSGYLKVGINKKVQLVEGYIKNGRTYIQIRNFGEITNLYTLGYDKVPIITTKKAVTVGASTVTKGLKVMINGKERIVDGEIVNGRTYIQIRDFGTITGLYTLGYENNMPQIYY